MSILHKGRSFTANSGTTTAVLLEMNRCGNSRCFPHPILSLASEHTLKIPGAPAWR